MSKPFAYRQRGEPAPKWLADDSRDKRIEESAYDKFTALPDFWTKKTDSFQYTNMDDAIGSVKQEELICIARAIRDGDNKLAGDILAAALMRICVEKATDDLEAE